VKQTFLTRSSPSNAESISASAPVTTFSTPGGSQRRHSRLGEDRRQIVDVAAPETGPLIDRAMESPGWSLPAPRRRS
jgi:hypothetical protein